MIIAEDNPTTKRFYATNGSTTMREILNRTVANEIRRTGGVNKKDQNLLCYGYRTKVISFFVLCCLVFVGLTD